MEIYVNGGFMMVAPFSWCQKSGETIFLWVCSDSPLSEGLLGLCNTEMLKF